MKGKIKGGKGGESVVEGGIEGFGLENNRRGSLAGDSYGVN